MASELYTFDQFSPFSDYHDVFPSLDDILAATTDGGAVTEADATVTPESLTALLSSPPPREGLDNLSSYTVPEPLKSGEFSVPFDTMNGGAGGGSGVSGSLFAVAQQPANGGRTMQRSNSIDGKGASFAGLLESPFQPDLSSATQIIRPCGTGDLQFSPFSDYHDAFPTLDDILATTTNGGAAVTEADATVTLESLTALLSSTPPREGLDSLSSYAVPEPLKIGEFSVPFDAVNGGAGGGSGVSGSLFAVAQQPANGGSLFYRPSFTGLLESPFQPDLSSATQIRRACSAGDLQVNSVQNMATFPSNPLSIEGLEQPNFCMGKYGPEERRMKIHRYRLKRSQRNFDKTIKYPCRKALADNRLRIRGRFACNDEAVEISKASSSSTFHRYGGDGDHLSVESDHGGSSFGRGMPFYNTFGSAPSSCQCYNSN